MSIFETMMLVCFGLAWPFSIAKSYRSKSIQGKSPYFLVVLILGYVFGMLNKLIVRYDAVFFLYLLNFAMISTDLALFYRNKRILNASN